MIHTRIAPPSEIKRLVNFYREVEYSQPITLEDVFIIAEQDGQLCAALRLCREHDSLVLRGMRVHPKLRRQGVGTRLLQAAVPLIGSQKCYCIPHRHLESFYKQIGFTAIPSSQAPEFLQERLKIYLGLGLDVILMYRS